VGIVNFKNEYKLYLIMIHAPKHWLIFGWYSRRIIIFKQRYWTSDSNKNADVTLVQTTHFNIAYIKVFMIYAVRILMVPMSTFAAMKNNKTYYL